MKPYPLTDKDSIDLLMMGSVKAGFPSPAEEVREKLDLMKLLVQHSASTFFFRIDCEYTVKRVEIHEGGAFLMPCNEKNTKYKPIPVGPDNDFLIWGVVTWVIKKVLINL